MYTISTASIPPARKRPVSPAANFLTSSPSLFELTVAWGASSTAASALTTRPSAFITFLPTGIISMVTFSPAWARSRAMLSITPLTMLTLYAPQRPSSLPRTIMATLAVVLCASQSGDSTGASELNSESMTVCTQSRYGVRRRSTPSALCIFAEEIIFMAPVIFSEDATEPIRLFNSRSVAICSLPWF